MADNNFPYWTVIGRRYKTYEFALEFAKMQSVKLKKAITIMQRDDMNSPAFVLCNIKADENQLDMGL